MEAGLYDGFLPEGDRRICRKIQASDINDLSDLHPEFVDERLPTLFLHYKGRNFKESLSATELSLWEADRLERIKKQSGRFFASLNNLETLAKNGQKTADGRPINPEILEKLREWYRIISEKTSV